MEVTVPMILQAISTVGFPIVVALLFCYFLYKFVMIQKDQSNEMFKTIMTHCQDTQSATNQQLANFEAILNKFNDTLVKIDTKISSIDKK